MRQFLPVLAFVVLGTGCLERVRLPDPPPEDAPLKTRIAAYRALEPTASALTTVYQYGVSTGTSYDFVLLRGGWRVSDPRDLLTVVRDDSVTAKYTRDWEAKRNIYLPGLMLCGAGVGVGLVTAVGGLVVTGGQAPMGPILGTAGVGMFLVSIAASGVFAIIAGFANLDRNAAMAAYHDSLVQRLRLAPEDLEQGGGVEGGEKDRKLQKIRYERLPANLRPSF
jgi:hypothetical protein